MHNISIILGLLVIQTVVQACSLGSRMNILQGHL